MEVVILYTCDIWKTNDSLRLKGVFTNKNKLYKAIQNLIDNETVQIDKNFLSIDRPLKNYSIDDLNNNIDYMFLQRINLNEEI